MTFDEAKDKLKDKFKFDIYIPKKINRPKNPNTQGGKPPIENILSIDYESDEHIFIIGTYKEMDGTESLAIHWASSDGGKKGYPNDNWVRIPKDKEVLKVFTQELKNLL